MKRGDAGVELRPLAREDTPLLLRLIEPEAPELVLTERDLYRNLFDDPGSAPGLGFGAFAAVTLVGAVSAVVRPGPSPAGHLKVLAVHPAFRRRGIGRRLLAAAIDAARRAGARRVQTDGAAPVYLLPGLPVRSTAARRLLEAEGFREVEERSSMTVDLLATPLDAGGREARLRAIRIELRRAGPPDLDALAAWIRDAFSPEWAAEVGFALESGDASVHIALSGEAPVGFAAAGIWSRNGFGPMGTAPSHEGLGIGGSLLARCLLDLRAAGQRKAVVSWVGPEAFYRRHAGAETTLRYVLMEKEIP